MKQRIHRLLPLILAILVVIGIFIATANKTHYRKPVRLKSTENSDWQLTVYYTAVDKYHNSPPIRVYGSRDRNHTGESVYLGSFPRDFVNIIKTESSGLITKGPHAGEYLNYDTKVGFWLDTSPIDALDRPLKAYVSVAGDPSIPFGTRIKIISCGIEESTGQAVGSDISNKIKSSRWIVVDRFGYGCVGRHLDLYIGQEDRSDFAENSPRSISTVKAKVMLSKP